MCLWGLCANLCSLSPSTHHNVHPLLSGLVWLMLRQLWSPRAGLDPAQRPPLRSGSTCSSPWLQCRLGRSASDKSKLWIPHRTLPCQVPWGLISLAWWEFNSPTDWFTTHQVLVPLFIPLKSGMKTCQRFKKKKSYQKRLKLYFERN